MKITPLVFIMKAVAKALEAFPAFNSSLSEDGESLILKKYVNVGIAVDTPNGLVVPVFKDVNKKGIYELSEELMAVSKKARADGGLVKARKGMARYKMTFNGVAAHAGNEPENGRSAITEMQNTRFRSRNF